MNEKKFVLVESETGEPIQTIKDESGKVYLNNFKTNEEAAKINASIFKGRADVKECFMFTVREILERNVCVYVDNKQQAEESIKEKYNNSDIILDAGDFTRCQIIDAEGEEVEL